MRILLDECIDWRLSREIIGHDVSTAHQMGWDTIENGALLTLAAQHFDAFITVDRNLSFQQNLASFPIAVIILQAKTNRLVGAQASYPKPPSGARIREARNCHIDRQPLAHRARAAQATEG